MSYRIHVNFPHLKIYRSGKLYSVLTKRVVGKRMSGKYYAYSYRVNGRRKNKKIHRLVAEAFLPNPLNKKSINHINGNKLDNRVCNLEWATTKENTNHAVRTGLNKKRGQDNHNSKLSNDAIPLIKELSKAGFDQKSIAALFIVDQSVISKIVTGKTYSNLKYINK